MLDAIERSPARRRCPPGTLVLLTADHGMTPVSPRQTIYLNVGPHGAEVAAHLRSREPGGHPLAPAGSCRDLFLHALPGHADELVGVLAAQLGRARGGARRRRADRRRPVRPAIPRPRLRARLGDVVVLPVLGDAVYWHTPGRFRQALWGQHGGLTAQEMEIPLIALTARLRQLFSRGPRAGRHQRCAAA